MLTRPDPTSAFGRLLRSTWAFGLVLLVLSLALRWPSLDLPLNRDEGVYATVALAWQQAWGLPYLDFLDHKPPLLYGLYAVAFKCGGWRPEALRLFATLWQAATTLSFGFLLRRWTRSQAVALLGAVVWAALASAWGSQAITANAETWGYLPVVLGLLCLQPWDQQQRLERWVLWGAAAGLAACIKQPFYLFALGLPVFFERGHWRGWALLSSALGLALVHGLLLAGLASQGALGAWWHWVFAFHTDYGTPLSIASLRGCLGLMRHLALEAGAIWALALWAALRIGAPGPQHPLRRMGLVFLALGLAASALSGRWYPHYAVFWTLGLALLVATAFQAPMGPVLARARGALGLLALFAFAWAQAPYWAAPDGMARSERLFGAQTFSQAPRAAAWVQSVSGPQDRLLVWGAEAELYFLAQRRPAGRFLSHYAFTGENPSWPGMEAELLAAVRDPRTKVVILSVALDKADSLQARLGQELQAHFEFRRDIAPPFWTGLRRP